MRKPYKKIRRKLKNFVEGLEFKITKFFLKRYVTYSLDQWDRWEFSTKFGPVYVDISRKSDGYRYDKLD